MNKPVWTLMQTVTEPKISACFWTYNFRSPNDRAIITGEKRSRGEFITDL